MSIKNTDEGLKRVVGVTGLALTVVNFSIGAGIYALPALIGIQLGAASVFGYVLCGLMFAAIMLCYVEIGSRVKTSGGSYAYVEKAFGPFAGFIVNWLFFFGWGIISDAAIMNLVADSLSVVFPTFLNPLMRIMLFAILMGLMIVVNMCGSKQSVRFVALVTIVKLLPLACIIIFGFRYIDFDNFRIEHFPSLDALNNTALILFFSLAGFESSLNVSGEIKDSKRTVPRGVLLGGLTVFIIYILIQTITQGVLGTQLSEFKDAPLAAVAEKIIGTEGVTILLFAAVVSGLGCVNGDVLASSRLLFAGANDGLFPKFLGKIHPRFATPYLAVITYAVLIFILSVSGGFKQLATLASGALLLIYLAVILALIKLRMAKEDGGEKSFKVPGGLLIPGIAIASITYVLSNLNRKEVISIAVFVAAVCVIYLVMMKWQKKSDGNRHAVTEEK
jgi:basic amino acid/polyamine antiporter, APA family